MQLWVSHYKKAIKTHCFGTKNIRLIPACHMLWAFHAKCHIGESIGEFRPHICQKFTVDTRDTQHPKKWVILTSHRLNKWSAEGRVPTTLLNGFSNCLLARCWLIIAGKWCHHPDGCCFTEIFKVADVNRACVQSTEGIYSTFKLWDSWWLPVLA